MAIDTLDKAFRLTPWSLPEHKAYVSGQYGKILGQQGQEAADLYIENYIAAEKKDNAAYEGHQEALTLSSAVAGAEPQTLPSQEKLSWDPRATFGEVETPKKTGRPAKTETEKVKEVK